MRILSLALTLTLCNLLATEIESEVEEQYLRQRSRILKFGGTGSSDVKETTEGAIEPERSQIHSDHFENVAIVHESIVSPKDVPTRQPSVAKNIISKEKWKGNPPVSSGNDNSLKGTNQNVGLTENQEIITTSNEEIQSLSEINNFAQQSLPVVKIESFKAMKDMVKKEKQNGPLDQEKEILFNENSKTTIKNGEAQVTEKLTKTKSSSNNILKAVNDATTKSTSSTIIEHTRPESTPVSLQTLAPIISRVDARDTPTSSPKEFTENLAKRHWKGSPPSSQIASRM